jgi:cytochrome b subunit of formate dehydrogenase
MTLSERTTFTIAALICFSAVFYGIMMYFTHLDARLSDIYSTFIPLFLGIFFVGKVISTFSL